jgi:hypothetical protein
MYFFVIRQVFASALQSQLKAGTATFTMAGGGGALRQVAVTQIGGAGGTVRAAGQQILQGQAIVRGQPATGLIVSHHQPAAPRHQTLTLQRPQQVGLVSAAAARPAAGGIRQQVMVAAPQTGSSPSTTTGVLRPAPQQLVMSAAVAGGGGVMTAVGGGSPRGARPTQVVVVSTSAATRQHYVITSSHQSAGGGGPQQHHQAQLVTLTGGQTVRPGQIVQVAGPSGQQHQIVVSQSGQIVLQSPTATAAAAKQQQQQQQQ